MRIKSIIAAGIGILISVTAFGQELYMPRDVQKAYKNKTRDMSGKPGVNYWQNHGSYTIKIDVMPPSRTVHGSETITYSNNSPDTLQQLSFKLILNQHKPGAVQMFAVEDGYLTSGVHIDSYSENGVKKNWGDSDDGINWIVELEKPLLPKGEVKLDIDWHYDLSDGIDREGVIDDSTSFFLAYFYPRVAVYDDYMGWDKMAFTGRQEFYNDFNDYNFEVSVPKNYIVWATGTLLNPNEVLQPEYAAKLKKSMTSDEVIQIATPQDLLKQQITKQADVNTWKWKAENVSDVALAVSNTYNWDAGSVVVDAKTNRRASVQAAYDEKATDFQAMVEYGKHSLKWFSENTPGVAYPYSKMTVVRGFADMEYPMMANDSSNPEEPRETMFTAEHEIAHTWFPFYMGINETRFAYMDEGWATAMEYLIAIDDIGVEEATEVFKNFRVTRVTNDASLEANIPIILPSNTLRGKGLAYNMYEKAALGYLAVRDMLGEATFNKVLRGYMDRWHGKHPIPWDFFNSFNDLSGKNLNWFWERWYYSMNYIDMGIEKVEIMDNGVTITLRNTGGMPAPVDIVLGMQDGTSLVYHQTPEIWETDAKTAVVVLSGVGSVKKVSLDGGIFMDAVVGDDVWEK